MPELCATTEQRSIRGYAYATNPVTVISGTAYFTYLGYTIAAFTPKQLMTVQGNAGAGAQTAEMGLFSTPLAPNRAAQSLTKLVATGAITNLTGSFQTVTNTAPFATPIAAGVHLWGGFRSAMAVTQPDIAGPTFYPLTGEFLVVVGSGVLTGAGPFAGVLPGGTYAFPNPVGLHLVLTLD